MGEWQKMIEGGKEEGCEWSNQLEDVVIFFEDAPPILKTRMVGGD